MGIEKIERLYTRKQMGDASEMLIAAELTLAGAPAMKVPDFWPNYDVICQRNGNQNERISVKSRTWNHGGELVRYRESDEFEWLAVVIFRDQSNRSRDIYIIPKIIADERGTKVIPSNLELPPRRQFRVDKTAKLFPEFRDNFALKSY